MDMQNNTERVVEIGSFVDIISMVIKWVWEGLDVLNLKMMLIGVRNRELGLETIPSSAPNTLAPASASTDTRCAVVPSWMQYSCMQTLG